MKALTFTGPWELDLADRPDLHVTGDDDVVVDIAYCGVCGTDLGIASGAYPVAVPGVTLGHEAAGVVAEVGAGVGTVAPGDRVVINPTPYCGRCRMCRTNRINHCERKHGTESGVSYDGAFAGRYRTTSAFTHRVPDRVPLRAAALTEPLSCVVTGVRRIQPASLAMNTYVIGAGPLGLLYAWMLSLRGLTPTVVERSPARLDFARSRLPAGSRAIPHLRGDEELDIVVDTTSHLLEELLPRMAPGGTFMSIGLKERIASIDTMLIGDRSLTVVGSIDSLHGSFEEAFHLIASGRVPAERLISHTVPLADYRKGFAALGCDLDARRLGPAPEASCKVLLMPGEHVA
ncbi:zinc-dependent alcohol dehydrogenase [Catenuloplanes atrovinosus]|uniref:Threonine dehydrogenase-like Zn-dependent dehydrogenase n=1 Tax=Catenuloplanes atrovinosus TaxID=137266 RepID=A0AAE4C8W1_9ACTN|nr:alcohol dehydrogenase catalytic domain-containing protein [Catenuloplanes atrovinosus]MDR7275413.1 threonine dehydrogenase-like Zn-dependent dehydrogenase [Catenuloplanes atrovinosus]